jgi:hypothetical protein
MNFTANHGKYDTVKYERSYFFDDLPVPGERFLVTGQLYEDNKIFIPELCSCNYPSHFASVYGAILLIGAVFLFILCMTGIIQLGNSNTHASFFIHLLSFVNIGAYTLAVIPLIIYLSDYRYFIFQDDKVIFQSKWLGRRIYDLKDLQFHLFRVGDWNMRYQLEIELPDSSIPEPRRQIIIESAASKKTMEGLLAVFFPLIQGELEPYYSAVPRNIEPIAPDGGNSWWWRYENIENHFRVWFWNYKVNQFIFWLVHGSQEKLMAKERKRDDIFSILN